MMTNYRLLDLFCGAGGTGVGYSRAGFDVTGVDFSPQPNYPLKFIQADALMYAIAFGRQYDVIHASPPCQAYSSMTPDKSKHKAMIAITRRVLKFIGKPYIIENVYGARHDLINPIMLCGTMFDLQVIRHRYFESNPQIWFASRSCSHYRKVVDAGRQPDTEKNYHAVYGNFSNVEFARIAMGIDWMTGKELAQAIPPAYTEWLGTRMIERIQNDVE